MHYQSLEYRDTTISHHVLGEKTFSSNQVYVVHYALDDDGHSRSTLPSRPGFQRKFKHNGGKDDPPHNLFPFFLHSISPWEDLKERTS